MSCFPDDGNAAQTTLATSRSSKKQATFQASKAQSKLSMPFPVLSLAVYYIFAGYFCDLMK
jgi:hypothetical protein